MMFSFCSKRFLGKRKASVRVGETGSGECQWSQPFTLDAIEHADKVTCKTDSKTYEFGVTIKKPQLSKSSLTKIITFTPYYLIYNTTENPIEFWEMEALDMDNVLLVGPGQMVPFWPEKGATQVKTRL